MEVNPVGTQVMADFHVEIVVKKFLWEEWARLDIQPYKYNKITQNELENNNVIFLIKTL